MIKYKFIYDQSGALYSIVLTYDSDKIAIQQANLNPMTHEVREVRTGRIIWRGKDRVSQLEALINVPEPPNKRSVGNQEDGMMIDGISQQPNC